MRLSKPILLAAILVLTGLFLAGCQGSTTPTPPAPGQPPALSTATLANDATPPEAAPTEPGPAPSATAVPPRTLVMCLPAEPQTLNFYAGSSRSMWSVLEAVYDGPVDTRGYLPQPVILEDLPSLENGGAQAQPVEVRDGDLVVDADGNLAALAAGTRVLPSGCAGPDCALAWDGQSALEMDQLAVTFRLLPGLTWSDGAPLTAADSVFSYTVAADPATPASKTLTDRTFSYEAADERSVVWTGLPGYTTPQLHALFFPPLPRHALEGKSPAQLRDDPALARAPLGWGPYIIEDWVAGDHIRLRRNPNYFRAAEGLPRFDHLVVRFVGEAADGNMNAVLAGECDVVDLNPQFLQMFPDLAQREVEAKLKMHLAHGPEWEHLDFGIRPAAYDDGYDPAAGDRPDFFGDARVRQAFASCIDRAGLNEALFYNRSAVPESFLPPSHPLYAADLPGYPYQPEQGQALLEEAGWLDPDGDPATARVASGASGIPDGTPLALTYYTTEAPLRVQAAQAAAAGLRGCGVGVQVNALNPGELFAPGPEGLVFGRRFDLVQFAWEASARPNCQLYTSAQIPAQGNSWIGANVTGYASPDFDAACAGADSAQGARALQELFHSELPVIPLYAHLKIAIARPDLCGLELDPAGRSIFAGLEGLNYGPGCP